MPVKERLATLVPIRNKDRAIRFFCKNLGGRLVYRGRGEMRNMWASVSLAGSELWLIVPEKREKRSMAYTTFVVRDIRKFVARLKAKGIRFQRAVRMGPQTRIEGPIAFETFGAAAFFPDSEGNLWMAWENFPPM